MLPIFDKYFGAHRRCDVCSIGLEPNPKHASHLADVQRKYRSAGAPVLILFAAASTSGGNLTFDTNPRDDLAANIAHYGKPVQGVTVAQLDLATVVRLVHTRLRESGSSLPGVRPRVVMKLDIEGHEVAVWPHLRATGAFCLVDVVFIEWHDAEWNLRLHPWPDSDTMRAFGADLARVRRGAQLKAKIHAWLRKLMPSSCAMLEIVDLDDESGNPSARMPAPHSLCPGRKHRGGAREP